MEHLAVVAGSLHDPIFWLMLAAAAVAAVSPGRLFVFVVVMAGASLFRVHLVDAQRAAAGLRAYPMPEHLFIATSLAMTVVFAGAVLLLRPRGR